MQAVSPYSLDDHYEITRIEDGGQSAVLQIRYKRLAQVWIVYYWNNVSKFIGERNFGADGEAARYAYSRIKTDLDAMREGLK